MNASELIGLDSFRQSDLISRDESMNPLSTGRKDSDFTHFFPLESPQQNLLQQKHQYQIDQSLVQMPSIGVKTQSKQIEHSFSIDNTDCNEYIGKQFTEMSKNCDKLEPMIISLSQRNKPTPIVATSKDMMEKKQNRINKKHKYLNDLLENSMVMQSAKKEKQKQQESMRQFLEQENRYLKNVYGKHYDQSEFLNSLAFTKNDNLSQNHVFLFQQFYYYYIYITFYSIKSEYADIILGQNS